jgi:hypothetical protein
MPALADGFQQVGARIGWGSGRGPWGRELIWETRKGRGSPVRALYSIGGLTKELTGG